MARQPEDLHPSRVIYSDAALQALTRANPGLRLELDPNGNLVTMNPTKSRTGHRNSRLIAALENWADADGTGLTFDSSTGFRLPVGSLRSPDASWVRRDRWEALTSDEQDSFAPLCPDFVVELLSDPADLAGDQAKMQEFMRSGARLGWIIDPFAHHVHVYRQGEAVQRLHAPTVVDGDPVLPGFVLQLSRIWD